MPLSPRNTELLIGLWQQRQVALREGRDWDARSIFLEFDEVFDNRDRPVAIAADGEILWPGSPPWQVAQATVVERRVAATTKPTGELLEDPFTPAEKARLIRQARAELGMRGYGPGGPLSGDPNA